VPAIALLGASASAPVTVPRFTGATICPAGSALNTPRGIRPVVSAVFAPLHPARGQPTDGRQSLASILATARRIAAPWSPVPQRERCIASRLAEWRIWQIAGTYTDGDVLGSERCRYATAGGMADLADCRSIYG
jgi:hypothetical protein